MKRQVTTLALLLAVVAFISINSTTYKVKDTEPINYNSFGDKVTDKLQEGIEKFKEEYPKLNLSNDKFYIVFSQCNGEKTLMISYLYCKDCTMEKLVNATNRFMKVSNRLSLPVVFDVDLHHSSFFASKDNVRVRETRKGYAVSLDSNNEVTFSGFTDMN